MDFEKSSGKVTSKNPTKPDQAPTSDNSPALKTDKPQKPSLVIVNPEKSHFSTTLPPQPPTQKKKTANAQQNGVTPKQKPDPAAPDCKVSDVSLNFDDSDEGSLSARPNSRTSNSQTSSNSKKTKASLKKRKRILVSDDSDEDNVEKITKIESSDSSTHQSILVSDDEDFQT